MGTIALAFVLLVSQTGLQRPQASTTSPCLRYSFDSLQRMRAARQLDGTIRWTARDLVGRANAETTLNLAGTVQMTKIHRYDGWRRIATNEGADEKRFVFGHALDELLVQESGGNQLAPVVSSLGSTMKLLHGTGSIADQFRYDAYGEPLAGDSKTFSHLFAGAIYDHKAKLYDLRHRHYDPKIGRFLSRDPLGMHADPFNLGNGYSYAGNNPLTRRDPLGLMSEGFWENLAAGLNTAGEAVMGTAEGAFDLVLGIPHVALAGLNESKRMFDDVMCFGTNVPAQSFVGRKIQGHTEEGTPLIGAALLGTAQGGVHLVATIGDGLQNQANAASLAIHNGDARGFMRAATGIVAAGYGGAAALDAGLAAAGSALARARPGAMTAAGATRSATSEGPSLAKVCPDSSLTRPFTVVSRERVNNSGPYREISVIYRGDWKYVRAQAYRVEGASTHSVDVFCEGLKLVSHDFPPELTGGAFARILKQQGIRPSFVSVVMSNRQVIRSTKTLDDFFDGMAQEFGGSMAFYDRTIISPQRSRSNEQWLVSMGARPMGLEYPEWVLGGDCSFFYFDP